ncbi:hypothetical protein [Mangrovimonas sp. DI 80]|uniref:hypothetical protein n=1 Tax=Mangrovimonas sp. DI 80 TaxID=1779330 RepID=UPI00097589D7|nr:hypothetical protein [Mangrovimonas sp. DI 80]OMP29973.1 hypothetical protein BKM32_15325 [Mangrovimonas sp. DI 80]
METKEDKYPEGHFVGLWMGIFIAIFTGAGIPLSIATSNTSFIGIWPGLGVAVGLAVGQSIENKYKQEGKIRPLTATEQKRKRFAVMVGVALLTIGMALGVLFLFLNS